MEEDPNGEKRLGQLIYRSISLLVNLAALALVAYAGLWVKANVPSKTDLKEIQIKLDSVERSVLQLGETTKRIEDFEQRLRKLEQVEGRRFPPPRL